MEPIRLQKRTFEYELLVTPALRPYYKQEDCLLNNHCHIYRKRKKKDCVSNIWSVSSSRSELLRTLLFLRTYSGLRIRGTDFWEYTGFGVNIQEESILLCIYSNMIVKTSVFSFSIEMVLTRTYQTKRKS